MKILIINNWLHHKNQIGLDMMLEYIKKYIKYDLQYKNGIIEDLQDEKWDFVYSPATAIDTNLFPRTMFIFGPHFSVFPTDKLKFLNNRRRNSIYIQPSEWVKKLWCSMGAESILPVKILNFPVDTEKFNPIIENKYRNQVFIYFKRRKKDELNMIENYLKGIKLKYKLIDYEQKYEEEAYIDTLLYSKFGIILDAHESQGFAIEEALSCDVPLLVWDATSLAQEEGITFPDFPATSIPYWDKTCGETFTKWNEFVPKFNAILNGVKRDKYKPREFILRELSVKPCAERFVKLLMN
jgi:hypothetical protein